MFVMLSGAKHLYLTQLERPFRRDLRFTRPTGFGMQKRCGCVQNDNYPYPKLTLFSYSSSDASATFTARAASKSAISVFHSASTPSSVTP